MTAGFPGPSAFEEATRPYAYLQVRNPHGALLGLIRGPIRPPFPVTLHTMRETRSRDGYPVWERIELSVQWWRQGAEVYPVVVTTLDVESLRGISAFR